MNDPERHLVIVPETPADGDDPSDPSDVRHPMEALLEERFRGSQIEAWSGALARTSPEGRSPFAVRMTIAQVLEVAADAESRAEILEDLAHPRADGQTLAPSGATDDGDGCVADLRAAASSLRKVAADLVTE